MTVNEMIERYSLRLAMNRGQEMLATYDRVLNNIYRNYSTDDLVRMADIFKLRGQ